MWTHLLIIELGRPAWTHLHSYGRTWTHLDELWPSWIHLDSLEISWTHSESLGVTWARLDSLVLIWTHWDWLGLASASNLDSFGFNWAHSGAPGSTRTQTYLHSLGLTAAFYSPLEFTYSQTTQWKKQRLSCRNGEGGKASMTFGVHLRLTEAPRPRAHDTNRSHGYEGGCLEASSLPQPR